MTFRPALTVTEWPSVRPTESQSHYRDSVHWTEHAPLLIDNGTCQAIQ